MDTHTKSEEKVEHEAATDAQTGCCGGAAPQGADACCALDAELKSTGGSGCGCAPQTSPGASPRKDCC